MASRSAIALFLTAALATGGCDRKSPAPVQANALAADEVAPDEVSPDEVSPGDTAPAAATADKVDRSHHGEPAPAVSFTAPDGKPVTLAAFRGKPVLLNLWATWCAPCIKEMPSLDAAAARLGERVTVLAVSQDLGGKAQVAPFFAARKLARLAPYTDTELGLSLGYKANLPTTILLDAKGNELWRVAGGMDWTGAEATRLLAEA